jgi:hypothetical protein
MSVKKRLSLGTGLFLLFIFALVGYGAYFFYNLNQEGDPFFVFYEVEGNETLNSTTIHLTDNDILNKRGVDVKIRDEKIIRIYIRNSQGSPEILAEEFNTRYGSSPYNKSQRKILEYRGVYYFAEERIP